MFYLTLPLSIVVDEDNNNHTAVRIRSGICNQSSLVVVMVSFCISCHQRGENHSALTSWRKNYSFYCATRMHSACMPWQDVRPSVCHTPVLCLNRYRYPQFFSPSGSPTILIFSYQMGWRYSDGNLPNRGVECKGYDKMTIFSQISRSISETVIVRWAHAARQFVSIEFTFHPFNI